MATKTSTAKTATADTTATTKAAEPKVVFRMSVEDAVKYNNFATKSAKIRFLHSLGWTTGAIAKHMGIRYQHARNVLVTPVANPMG